MKRCSCTASLALIALILASTAAGADGPATRPGGVVYRFSPGQHLTYQSTTKTTGAIAEPPENNTTQLWVLRTLPTGGWRMVARDSEGQTDSFDVSPSGAVSNSAFGMPRIRLERILPELPQQANQREWTSTNPFGESTRYRFEGEPANGVVKIAGTEDSDMGRIYLYTSNATFDFDAAQGVVRRIKRDSEQKYGIKRTYDESVTLSATDTVAPEVLAAMNQDEERFGPAVKQYIAAMRAAEKDIANLDLAERALKGASAQAQSSPYKETLNTLLASHTAQKTYYKDRAERRPVLNKPAPAFDLRDLDGTSHRLADLKGKVVVLDFWYRGCGWCIRAMPQIAQIVNDFKNQPVAVFGMNTDAVVEDAQFTANTMKLNYPTLMLGSDRKLVEAFGVSGFPTLIIIDPNGNLADVHVGWSQTLREDVGESIRKLLPATAAAAQ